MVATIALLVLCDPSLLRLALTVHFPLYGGHSIRAGQPGTFCLPQMPTHVCSGASSPLSHVTVLKVLEEDLAKVAPTPCEVGCCCVHTGCEWQSEQRQLLMWHWASSWRGGASSWRASTGITLQECPWCSGGPGDPASLVLAPRQPPTHPALYSSVQFSCSVMSNSLRPHESQHARPPCPSPTPGVYSNSCPLSQ